MNLLSLLPLLLFLFIFAGLIAVTRRQGRRTAENLARLATGATGIDGNHGSGEHRGQPFTYAYRPGGRNSPPQLTVTVPLPGDRRNNPLEFDLRREGAFDRFFKGIGLSVEPQSGDPRFDRKVYIASEQPRLARSFFQQEEVRSSTLDLLGRGYTALVADAGTVQARWRGFRFDKRLPEHLIVETAGQLAKLAERLPRHAAPGEGSNAATATRRRVLVYSGVGLAIVTGVGGIVTSNMLYEPLEVGGLLLRSLPFGAGLLAVYLLFAARLLAGRSRSHREWATAALFALPAFPAATYGTAATLNGWLDHSPGTPHVTTITGRHVSHGKHTAYHLYLRSWRRPQNEKLTVNRSIYRAAEHASKIEIVTHPGHFDAEWIESYRIAE